MMVLKTGPLVGYLGHEGVAIMNSISALVKGTLEKALAFHFPYIYRKQRWQFAAQKRALTKP
jgi:hypothetical protein